MEEIDALQNYIKKNPSVYFVFFTPLQPLKSRRNEKAAFVTIFNLKTSIKFNSISLGYSLDKYTVNKVF